MTISTRMIVSVCLLSFSIFSTTATQAQEKVVIVASKIEKLMDDDLRGAFARYLLAVIDEAALEAELRIVPSKRADAIFNNRKADIRYPEFNPPARTTKSVPSLFWGSIKRYAFTRHPVPAPKKPADLAGHKILLVNNYRYGLDYQSLSDEDVHFAPSETSNLNMLMRGRGTVMIAVTREVVPLAQKQGIISQLNYDPAHPIEQKNLAMAVQDTPRGHALLRRLNKAIKNLSASGQAKKLLGPGLYRELTDFDLDGYKPEDGL